MATELISIFGNDISGGALPRIAEISFVGFPGAHGVTSMNLGTRGKPFIIAGRLSETGSNYDDARASLNELIAEIEALQGAEAADYTFHGDLYENLQFIRLEIVPDGKGKIYHMISGGVFVNFIMHGHILE